MINNIFFGRFINKFLQIKQFIAKIYFFGLKNVFNILKKSKCFILSSLWEDPGFIMVEAASVGTPILTSNCPSGPKEFIGNNENGFIFDSNNEKSFKMALHNFWVGINEYCYVMN